MSLWVGIPLIVVQLTTAAHAATGVRHQVGSESPEPTLSDGSTPIVSEATLVKILIGIGLAFLVFGTAVVIGLLMGDQTRLGRWARGGGKPLWRSPTPELFRGIRPPEQ